MSHISVTQPTRGINHNALQWGADGATEAFWRSSVDAAISSTPLFAEVDLTTLGKNPELALTTALQAEVTSVIVFGDVFVLLSIGMPLWERPVAGIPVRVRRQPPFQVYICCAGFSSFHILTSPSFSALTQVVKSSSTLRKH